MESLLRSSLPHCTAPEQLIIATHLLILLENPKRDAKIVTCSTAGTHRQSYCILCMELSAPHVVFFRTVLALNKIQRDLNKKLRQRSDVTLFSALAWQPTDQIECMTAFLDGLYFSVLMSLKRAIEILLQHKLSWLLCNRSADFLCGGKESLSSQ